MPTSSITLHTSKVQSIMVIMELTRIHNVYMFIGREQNPWLDDENPPNPLPTYKDEIDARTNMDFLTKITTDDAIPSIRRTQWTSGTIYQSYSYDDPLLFAKNFFVVNAIGNVYKCLFSPNTPSTDAPTSTPMESFQTTDGYVWKFMYNIPSEQQRKFYTNTHIPVPVFNQRGSLQLQVEASAVQTATSPVGGHGKSAVDELGADNITFSKEMIIRDRIENHRQLGIIVNPEDNNGNILTDSDYFVHDSNTDINLMSGRVIMIANHSPVNSTDDGFRQLIKIVSKF